MCGQVSFYHRKPCGPQGQEYLLSGPLLRMFALMLPNQKVNCLNLKLHMLVSGAEYIGRSCLFTIAQKAEWFCCRYLCQWGKKMPHFEEMWQQNEEVLFQIYRPMVYNFCPFSLFFKCWWNVLSLLIQLSILVCFFLEKSYTYVDISCLYLSTPCSPPPPPHPMTL